MQRLIEVKKESDILPIYRGTPIGKLIQYHNLGKELIAYENAELLIGMCMDNRKMLIIPDKFAYIIRTGGGNMQQSGFKISYAIAVGGVQHIALIGHTQCGMANLKNNKQLFIQGLVERAGWSAEQAEKHYSEFAPEFGIGNEVDFTLSEVNRIRKQYPKIMVAPLLYKVEDNLLYQIPE